MSLRSFAALLLTIASSLQLAATKECNAAVATPQSEYSGIFTWQGQTMTVSPVFSSRTISGNFQATNTPTGGSSANSWIDWGHEAVDNVGTPKLKRQSSKEHVECLGAQICMNNEGGVPFCLDGRTGGWHGATGYEGNAVTGNYTTPDGTKGNVYKGPCPGSYYVETSRGCAIVPSKQRVETPSTSGSSSNPTPTSKSVSSSTTDSAAGCVWKRGEIQALLVGPIVVALL